MEPGEFGLILQNYSLLDIFLKAVVELNKPALAASYLGKKTNKRTKNAWPTSPLQWRKAMHSCTIFPGTNKTYQGKGKIKTEPWKSWKTN